MDDSYDPYAYAVEAERRAIVNSIQTVPDLFLTALLLTAQQILVDTENMVWAYLDALQTGKMSALEAQRHVHLNGERLAAFRTLSQTIPVIISNAYCLSQQYSLEAEGMLDTFYAQVESALQSAVVSGRVSQAECDRLLEFMFLAFFGHPEVAAFEVSMPARATSKRATLKRVEPTPKHEEEEVWQQSKRRNF